MTPQELKNSILQLAVQGKLTDQRVEDCTAEELYLQIQEEKQRLIKEGKIKKEKPLPEITEDEIPFEIPESWKWVHINDIATTSLGKTLDKQKNTGEYKRYLCSINVYWNGIDLSKVKEAKFEKSEQDKYLLKQGDLLICEGGEVGRTTIWNCNEEMYYQNALHRVRFFSELNPYYYKCIFELYKGIGIIDRYSKGVTIKHLVQKSLYSIPFPLPPLAEQKRIVAKIEELLPYIDRYEKAWSKLEEFNKRFPDDMQKSVLQMAIQGKLNDQRAEDGTGEELYQKIQEEKQRLIKEGKIKREKPLPEITEDEIPFEIPESWKWVRLSDIANMCLGKMLDKAKNKGELHPYLRNVNVRWGCFDLSNLLEMRFEEDETERYSIKYGDLVVCEGGEPGRCAVWADKQSTIRIQKALHRIRFYGEINSFFIYRIFELYASIGFLARRVTGTTIKHLPGVVLAKILIPLPPLSEQKRIVHKLEQILPLCNNLSEV